MVGNFGVSGSTLLNAGDKPYQKEAAFAKALDFKPQVLVIMLGTNDTKPWNFRFSGNFEADYRDLVSKFKALPGTPLIFVSKPIPVTGQGKYSINEQNLQIFIPVIEQFAARDGLRLLDLHAAFTGHADDLPDTVHPNDAGAERIARSVHAALTGASR